MLEFRQKRSLMYNYTFLGVHKAGLTGKWKNYQVKVQVKIYPRLKLLPVPSSQMTQLPQQPHLLQPQPQ